MKSISLIILLSHVISVAFAQNNNFYSRIGYPQSRYNYANRNNAYANSYLNVQTGYSGYASSLNRYGNAPTGYNSVQNSNANAQNNYASGLNSNGNTQTGYASGQIRYANAQNNYANSQNNYANVQNRYPYARSNANAQSVNTNAQNNLANSQNGNGQSNAPASSPNNQYSTLERPCPTLSQSCIGTYLSQYSNCRIPSAAVQEPFFVDTRVLELPSINVTIIHNNIELSNILSGIIDDFTVDRTNGFVVLSVNYTDLTLDVAEARYETNRRADIPLVEVTSLRIEYPQLSITTVFPSANRLDLALTRSTGYQGSLALFEAGEIVQAVENISENMNSTDPEAQLSTAPLVNRLFIQNLLCDYGITPNQLGYGQ